MSHKTKGTSWNISVVTDIDFCWMFGTYIGYTILYIVENQAYYEISVRTLE
jgi:hypothetical protein